MGIYGLRWSPAFRRQFRLKLGLQPMTTISNHYTSARPVALSLLANSMTAHATLGWDRLAVGKVTIKAERCFGRGQRSRCASEGDAEWHYAALWPAGPGDRGVGLQGGTQTAILKDGYVVRG